MTGAVTLPFSAPNDIPTLPADTDVVFDLAHFLAADAVHDQSEALMRAGLLDEFRLRGLDARVRRFLASRPEKVSDFVRVVDAANFTDDPEQDRESRIQAILAGLDAVGALAGSMTTSVAGRASVVARRADEDRVKRNARILKLAAAVGETVSEARRWQIVRNRMGRHAPSVATIRRVVKGSQK